MNTRAVFLATSSFIVIAGITTANAADIYAPSSGSLKDPVVSDEIVLPEATVFQETADWYIRGDFGVGSYSGLDGSGSASGANFGADGFGFDPVYSGGIGFGHYLTPNIRLGVDLEYRH
jgi:hypothetical protein